MVDILNPVERSALMARVRRENTKPEMVVRRLVHSFGYRYRLHRRNLPGKPDLAFISRRKVIFVHGCFWHGHAGCSLATIPKTRRAFWCAKFEANRTRDRRVRVDLKRAGWASLVVWECETRHPEGISDKLVAFLEAPNRTGQGALASSMGSKRRS